MIHHKGDGWWGIRKPDIQLWMPGFRFTRMLKNAPAYRQAGMCVVALIFTLLDKVLQTRRWSKKIFASTKHDVQSFYASDRASRCGVHQYISRERIYAFPTKDVGRSRERDFAKLNLHLGIFEHPLEKILFQQLLVR
jgi:hypothetical protein